MFLGHFGVGFGAKAAAQKTSLGTLFLASQFIDLLWPTLLLLGLEAVTRLPAATGISRRLSTRSNTIPLSSNGRECLAEAAAALVDLGVVRKGETQPGELVAD